MKLYISIDYKNKNEMGGVIKNRTRNINEEIYFFYEAKRINDTMFSLDIWKSKKWNVLNYTFDETIGGSMTAKNILYFVENQIDEIWKEIKVDTNQGVGIKKLLEVL